MIQLGLPTLEYRRASYDMLQVYKCMHNIDDTAGNLFSLNESITRGHNFKIYRRQCRLKIRDNSFAFRVTDTWNRLPARVVNAETINSFKFLLNETSWNRHKFIPT